MIWNENAQAINVFLFFVYVILYVVFYVIIDVIIYVVFYVIID